MLSQKKSYSVPNCSSVAAIEKSQNGQTVNNTGIKTGVKHNPFLAFFYTFISSTLWMLTSVIVKKLTYMSPAHMSLIRSAFMFTGCLPVAIFNVKEVFGGRDDILKLVARGFLGSTALFLNLNAARYLPLAEVAIVMSTTPALTSLFAFFYLKEPFSVVQGFALVMTTTGVLLSVRLPELLSNRESTHFDSVYLGGLASAIGSVMFLSVALVTLRKMKNVHYSVPVMYYGFIGVAENALVNSLTSTFENPMCGWDSIFLMLVGVFGFMGQCAQGSAVQREAVGIIAIMKASLDIIIAMLFQVIFFDEKLDAYNISGACLVIASVSTMGIRNWLGMLPEESEARKRLKLFLR